MSPHMRWGGPMIHVTERKNIVDVHGDPTRIVGRCDRCRAAVYPDRDHVCDDIASGNVWPEESDEES
jgi:hypothetical protein